MVFGVSWLVALVARLASGAMATRHGLVGFVDRHCGDDQAAPRQLSGCSLGRVDAVLVRGKSEVWPQAFVNNDKAL